MPNKLIYRQNFIVFMWAFIALNITFAFYQASFFFGNHDWDWVKGTTQVLSLNTGMFEGRYAKFILNVLLFGGQILPLLNTQLAFAWLATGAVLLTSYWQIQKISARILISLMITLAPFVLGWLYFSINILGNFAIVPLVAGGLLLSERLCVSNKMAAVICFLLALGIYPSAVEMIFCCWCFRYILTPPQQLKNIFPSFLIIIVSLALFKIILYLLTAANIIYAEHYNMQTVSVQETFFRFPRIISLMCAQLWETVPFFPSSLKITGVLLVIMAMIMSIRSSLNMVLWTGALGATVASALLTITPEEIVSAPRVNFYGLNYLYAGAATILLQRKGSCRNVGYVLIMTFLFISVNQNFYAQKVWKLGKIAEENLVERIIRRIEETQTVFPLTPVIAGELPLRPRYYAENYRRSSLYLLNTPFMVRHIPAGMFNFYEPTPLFYTHSQINSLSPELYAYLQNATKSWPSNASIYIDKNYAIVLLTSDGIKTIQSQLPK